MNCNKACKIFSINYVDFINYRVSKHEIKKKYHMLALRYHPDKCNLKDANDLFLDINEAYHVLIKNNEKDNNDYYYNFLDYLKSNINSSNILTNILENISQSKLLDIYLFLSEYKDILNINNEILLRIKKSLNIETIILNTTLNDLLFSNVHILNINDEKLIVPLWHKEIIYELENSNKILLIKCVPEMPDNIKIDKNNNVHISIDKKLDIEILDKNIIEITLGNRCIKLEINKIKLKQNQKIILKEQGIKVINDDIFNSDLSDVIIHLHFL